MKEVKVTMYEANDGVRFETATEAVEHEARLGIAQLLCRGDAPSCEADAVAAYIVRERTAVINILCDMDFDDEVVLLGQSHA